MENQITTDQILQKLKGGLLNNPSELANFLVILSASLFEVGETEKEMLYLKKWSDIKTMGEHTDKLTDALAKQTEEYREYRRMKVAYDTLKECIRSLKKKLANLQVEEMEGQNY